MDRPVYKSKTPLISFIVLNWNGLEDTKKCIKSINGQEYPNIELIIVDNGSSDGSKEYFRSLDGIIFVDLPENTGFTGGHIAGREAAHGEYLSIINNDLILDKNWLNACMETFNRHKDAAVVGGKSYKWNKQNPPRDTNNEFYSYQEIDMSVGYTRTLLTGGEECAVDSISGAALLIKQSALKKTGYFDNDFFAYYEEVDLIARLLRMGYKAYYNPEAYSWHKIAASSGSESFFYFYMMHRNRYLYAYKNFDEKYLKIFVRNYRREVIGAYLRYCRNRKDQDAAAKIKAYRWVRKNSGKIETGRKTVQKLGSFYNKKLWRNPRKDVTVIITCYNYGKFVGQAIDSALNQSLPAKKIVVINDGSTDNSKNEINKYKSNPNVKIIHKANEGVVKARNEGIKHSETYWTVFLDADDKLAKSFLKDTVKASRNGFQDIVYTDMRMFGAINDIFKAMPYNFHTLLRANYINNSALVKTSLLKQIGGLKPEMSGGLEDWEMYVSLVEIGAKPLYLPGPLVKYRQHKDLLSRRSGYAPFEKQLFKKMRQLHHRSYRRHGYYRTLFRLGLKFTLYPLRYPGMIPVLLRASPHAVKIGLGHIYRIGIDHVRGKQPSST